VEGRGPEKGKRAEPLFLPTISRERGEDEGAPILKGRVSGVDCNLLLDSGARVSVARLESFPVEVVKSLWRLDTRQTLVGITGHEVGTRNVGVLRDGN
jgi:hypothetical protein